MRIRKPGSQSSIRGPLDLFTGTVWIDYLHQPVPPARSEVQLVTFEPGARTVWHTHPLGQILVVMAGAGWIQSEGGAVEQIRPGDVVSIRPGEKHWHGATSRHVMTFLAIQEELDGKVVEPMDRVSDGEYASPLAEDEVPAASSFVPRTSDR